MNWQSLRDEFPATRQWAFLDHAGVSAISRPAADRMVEFARDVSENGSTCVGRWAEVAEQVRHTIARLLHADPLGIALVKNTTEAIDLIAEGYPWEAGDNVVFPADEYPSNQYPWMNLADRGVECRRVEPNGNRLGLDHFAAAIDARTRIVAVSQVGYASGFRIDLDKLGDLCRGRGVLLLVDAIQGLGVFPIDVSRSPIDFVACGSHKWLQGPQGSGFLYIRPELIERIRPVAVGAHSVVDPFNYGQIDFRLKPGAGRFEGGTPNFGGIASWGVAVDRLLGLVPSIAERVKALTDLVCDRAASAGARVFSSRAGGDWSGIVSLETAEDPAVVAQRCRAAGVVVNKRGGRVRVACHGYNNEGDLDRLFAALRG